MTAMMYRLRTLLHGSATPPLTQQTAPAEPLWMFGRRYADDGGSGTALPLEHFNTAVKRLVWCSYRREIPDLGSGCTSDAGWGCMLRTAQMLLAQTLIAHMFGDAYRTGCATDEAAVHAVGSVEALRRIVRLLADAPEGVGPFGVHAIVRTGAAALGMRVGEWYGPATIAAVIRDLVTAARPSNLRCCVAQDGTVYVDRVRAAITDLVDVSDTVPFLLLVPLRLGAGDTVNQRYLQGLSLLFRFPQCVGVIGGRPRSSLYFVAAQGCSTLFYLDPHVVQQTVPVSDGAFDVSSWMCQGVRRMQAADIDPSLAAGFFFHGLRDFAEFRAMLVHSVQPDDRLFSIEDVAPSDYAEHSPHESAIAVLTSSLLGSSLAPLSSSSPPPQPAVAVAADAAADAAASPSSPSTAA